MMRHDVLEAGPRYGLERPIHVYTIAENVRNASVTAEVSEEDVVAATAIALLCDRPAGSA